MSVLETNKDVVSRLVETGVSEADIDVINELVDEDYVRHEVSRMFENEGPEAFIEMREALEAGFSDIEIEIGEIICEGDLVAFQGTMTCIHDGPFMGVEPTGTEVTVLGNAMHRVRNGKVVETWATWDMLSLAQQIGAVELPTP